VVSPTGGAGRTELRYAPAVRVLAFPLSPGASWDSDVLVSGVAEGVPVSYGERYRSEVDARGEVVTPYASFEALRVRTELVRQVGLVSTTVRSHAFVAPCFGVVARLVSEDDEPEIEFARASEVLRLGF